MNREEIQNQLGDHPWGQSILLYDEVSSTNTLLKDLGKQGAPEGTVIIAERQSGGRGRLGRTFLSPGGVGIYMSVLIRPQVSPARLMHLTCAAAAAMCDAVETAAGIRPQVKWINDLVIGKRKLGGILTELSLDPKSGLVEYAVIGIGINCLQKQTDFDSTIRDMATSVYLATGNKIDRSCLAAEMIRALCYMNRQLLGEKDQIMEQYAKDCITVGQEIQVIRGDEVRPGKALGVDGDGGLLVRYENGETASVASGEVSIRGMYGYV